MSEFINSVQFELLEGRNRKPAKTPLSICSGIEEHTIPGQPEILYNYHFHASYSMVGYCKREDVDHLRKSFILSLKGTVFGEFEEKLILLQRAIYGEEFDESRKIVNDILEEVR